MPSHRALLILRSHSDRIQAQLISLPMQYCRWFLVKRCKVLRLKVGITVKFDVSCSNLPPVIEIVHSDTTTAMEFHDPSVKRYVNFLVDSSVKILLHRPYELEKYRRLCFMLLLSLKEVKLRTSIACQNIPAQQMKEFGIKVHWILSTLISCSLIIPILMVTVEK